MGHIVAHFKTPSDLPLFEECAPDMINQMQIKVEYTYPRGESAIATNVLCGG